MSIACSVVIMHLQLYKAYISDERLFDQLKARIRFARYCDRRFNFVRLKLLSDVPLSGPNDYIGSAIN